MITKDNTSNLIFRKEEIKETLSKIIRKGLDFVALGIVEKTAGQRFLLCEKGFKYPLWKTIGGRPEIYGNKKENPLDTVSREICEETGIITFQPKVDDIFLIQEIGKPEKKYYCIVFDLKYFSGEIRKGNEVAKLEEFTREQVCRIVHFKTMVPLHVPIWQYYLQNYWK